MFAVIKTGGKQYRVAPGDVLTVEKLAAINGDHFDFTEILMLSDGQQVQVGAPFVEGAVVKGRVINQERGEKVIVFKKKRRHNYRRKNGHRQYLTAVQIVEISGKGIAKKAEKLIEPKLSKDSSTETVKPEVKKVSKSPAVKKSATEEVKVKTTKAEKPKSSAASTKSDEKKPTKAKTSTAAKKTTQK